MCKRYRNVGMSVEDRILNGICDGCDQDMAKCYNQNYCEYDKEEVKENREENVKDELRRKSTGI